MLSGIRLTENRVEVEGYSEGNLASRQRRSRSTEITILRGGKGEIQSLT